MVAGFFILDLEEGKNIHQIDYYVPSEKKIAAFTLNHGVDVQLLEMLGSKVPEKMDLKTNIDLDALSGILEDEMKNRGITEEIKKIIAVIQSIDGKKVWNINCVLSGMGILRAHVDDSSQTILKMDKSSIMDYVKKMPGQLVHGDQGDQNGEGAMPKIESKKDLKETISKLEKLEEAIEKEKAQFKKKLEKKPKKAKDQ